MAESIPTETWSVKPVRELGHLELLAALIVLLVIQSFLSGATVSHRILVNVLLLAVVLSTIRTFSTSRRRLILAMTLGAVAFCLSCAAEVYHSQGLIAVIYVSYIVLFLLLIVVLGKDVFTGGPVTPNRIIGAVCIFFVFGLTWAFIYSLLHLFQPESFALASRVTDRGIQQDLIGDFLYFSNVTLTTLGYGDIIPVTRPARVFATLEAMLGELYIAIIIGRMVGLHISEKPRR